MVRTLATPPRALFCATAAVLLAGCFDTSSTITTVDYPTRLTVDPLSFRGSLQCGAPGLVNYVVRLFNVTANAPPDKLATTAGPVDCQNLVTFGDTFILSANYYTAAIDGYDRAVTPALDTFDGGRPRMLDRTSGEEVEPQWTTTCGEVPRVGADGEAIDDAGPYNQLRFPTQALGRSEVIVHGCLPLAVAPTADASTDDGSSGGGDASTDGEGPPDATSDAVEPDGSGPGDEDGASDGGTVDGSRR